MILGVFIMKLQGITSKIALFSNRKKVSFGKEVNDFNNSCVSRFESSIQHREITIKMLQDRKKKEKLATKYIFI